MHPSSARVGPTSLRHSSKSRSSAPSLAFSLAMMVSVSTVSLLFPPTIRRAVLHPPQGGSIGGPGWLSGGLRVASVVQTDPGGKMTEKNYDRPPEMALKPGYDYHAVLVTSQGTVRVRLFAEEAPETVNNFVFLARDGYFDGTTFHR